MKIRESMKIADMPQTDSIQELVHFWDTHDLTDFEDQLEEVSEAVFEGEASGELGNGADTVAKMKWASGKAAKRLKPIPNKAWFCASEESKNSHAHDVVIVPAGRGARATPHTVR